MSETAWWGDCANTWHEERKQLVYAPRMGLVPEWGGGHPPTFDLGGRSVVDLGGGPVSLLLKCRNRGRCDVVDPGAYPEWVKARYAECGIGYVQAEAETFESSEPYDEAWVYNVLQHVRDPREVIHAAMRAADTLRVFEWVGLDPYPRHPNRLEAGDLEEWVGDAGFTATVDQDGAVGTAWYGVFRAT